MPPKRVRNLTFFDFFILGHLTCRDARLVRPRCRRDYTQIFRHKNILPCGVRNGLTRNPRKTQKNLHVFARIYTEKRLTQRRKGREALRTFVLMSKILHADNAEPRRRFAELCDFA